MFIIILFLSFFLKFHIFLIIINTLIESTLDKDTLKFEGKTGIATKPWKFEIMDFLIFCYIGNVDIRLFGLFWGLWVLALCWFGLFGLRLGLVKTLEGYALLAC